MKRMILAVTERTQCRIAVCAAMVAASVVFPSFGEDGKDTADGGNVLVEKRAKPLEWLFPMGDATPHEGMAFDQTSRWFKARKGQACRAVQFSAVRDADGSVVVKAVNCSEEPQPCTISVKGGAFASAAKTAFTGPGARASNDPLRRDALNEVKGVSTVKDGEISETLPPLSLTVYRIAK